MLFIFFLSVIILPSHAMEQEKQLQTASAEPNLKSAIARAIADLSKEGVPARVAFVSDIFDPEPWIIQQSAALRLLSLDERGKSVRRNPSGSHAVEAIGAIHAKANCELNAIKPGIEAALYLFNNLLFPDQELLAPTGLLAFSHLSFKNDSGVPAPHCSKVAQASLTVTGDNFSNFLDAVQSGGKSFTCLDEANVSAHIVSSILTNPCDYKPGNLMVEYRNKKGFIKGIDNDDGLGDPIIQIREGAKKWQHYAGVKNILYCIPSLMQRKVHPGVRERIIKCIPVVLLADWLKKLETKNMRYEHLKQHMNNADYDALGLPIKLAAGTITKMLATIHKIKAVLRDNPHLTHHELLFAVQPLVACYYDAMIRRFVDAKETYIKINESACTLEEMLPLKKRLKSNKLIFEELRSEHIDSGAYVRREQSIEQALQELMESAQLSSFPFALTILTAAARKLATQGSSYTIIDHPWSHALLTSHLEEAGSNVKSCRGFFFTGVKYLRRDIYQQLWDASGKFIRHNAYGLCDLGYVQAGGKQIRFKRLPIVAGFEQAMHWFMRFFGYESSHLDLLMIDGQPFLISINNECIRMQEALEQQNRILCKNNPNPLEHLDLESTMKLIIIAMLLNPQDLYPRNIALEKIASSPEKYRLIIKDNESSLVSAIAKNEKEGKPEIQIKCALFCLEEMNAQIPSSIFDFFIKMKALEKFKEWLHEACTH